LDEGSVRRDEFTSRNADERVAVLRPKVPTRKITLNLVQHLARRLRAPSASERHRGKPNASKSAGAGQSTVKAGTSASPAHAT
jgi:hypothetical protein